MAQAPTDRPMLVRADSDVRKVATAVELRLRETGRLTMRAIGPHAISGMMKAIAIAQQDRYRSNRVGVLWHRIEFVKVPGIDAGGPPGSAMLIHVVLV